MLAGEIAMAGTDFRRQYRLQRSLFVVSCALLVLFVIAGPEAFSQDAPKAVPVPTEQDAAAAAQAERGQKQFAQSCAFCHGADATGARGPDLVRSTLVAHDQHGDLIGEVVRNGRPDKGMPALPLSAEQISTISSFLHERARQAILSSGVPTDYPVEKLMTGNAAAGKAFFEGAGGCSNCHSPKGDLAGIGKKYSSIELEAHMLYPGEAHKSAVITLPSGQPVRGTVLHEDEFTISLRDENGNYRSFVRESVKVDLHDPLEAHRKLLDKLTQAQMRNLFAYVYTLK
jgi:cytochrome c oxidase cbb3-type subunit 3